MSLPLWVSSSATVTPMVLVSLGVLLPGARPSSRYWCWTQKPTWPVARSIAVIVSTAPSVDVERVVHAQGQPSGRILQDRPDVERRVGAVVGIAPVHGQRVAVEQADVGVARR